MGVYIPYTRLPSAYQEVEYIESSGTQRIETGVTVNSENRVFKIKYGPLSSGDTLFGTLQFSNTEAAVHTRYSRLSNLIVWDCYKGNGYGRVSYSSSQSGIEEMELGNNYIKDIATGTTLTTGTVGNYSTSDVIPIFCYKVTDRTNQFSYAGFKLYYFQIIDNGTMIRDFVPCYRKLDTEIGLYDLVNDTFYTNSGTGTFTKGADVYMSELKNAYIGEYQEGWQPGANTLWYINMNQSDAVFTDTQGHTVNNNGITYNASGVSEGCGFNNSNGKRLYSDFNTGESFPSNFTIMGFMKPANNHFTTDHPMGIVLSDQANERLRGIGWNRGNTKAQFSFLQENVAWATYEYNATDSGGTRHERHHYALTYDGTTMIGYIDGIQVVNANVGGSGQGNYPLNGLSLFGRERSDQGFTNTIYGYVDEAICENKVWTASDLQTYLSEFTY